MAYDFTALPDRRRPDAVKWDVKAGELPMWVADMDFPCAPEIREALERRVDHGVFGYSDVPRAWNKAYASWWKSRHGLDMDPDGLIFTTGVIPAVSTAVRRFTAPAEKVVLLTPVYNIFYNSTLNNGRTVLECPLKNEDGAYAIDFDRLESALSDPQASLLIFCNPHNPVGRLWTKEELAEVGRLCKKHGVTVLSDEIHCDIARPGMAYVPFASVNATCRDISVTCIAPTKCFNLAGLQTAAVYVPEPFLRHKMRRALNTDEVAEPNAFAVDAAVAAFTKGGAWLDEMNETVYKNRDLAEKLISEGAPYLKVTRGDATYLMWIDCAAVTKDSRGFCDDLRKKTGLILSNGAQYGRTGETFVRLNLATSEENVRDGVSRLISFANALYKGSQPQQEE